MEVITSYVTSFIKVFSYYFTLCDIKESIPTFHLYSLRRCRHLECMMLLPSQMTSLLSLFTPNLAGFTVHNEKSFSDLPGTTYKQIAFGAEGQDKWIYITWFPLNKPSLFPSHLIQYPLIILPLKICVAKHWTYSVQNFTRYNSISKRCSAG